MVSFSNMDTNCQISVKRMTSGCLVAANQCQCEPPLRQNSHSGTSFTIAMLTTISKWQGSVYATLTYQTGCPPTTLSSYPDEFPHSTSRSLKSQLKVKPLFAVILDHQLSFVDYDNCLGFMPFHFKKNFHECLYT